MAGLFDNMRRELQTDAPGAHPEPDVLNAYMEGALSTKERESVVGHLSHCSDCRDVVALAAPPLSQTAPPASLKDPAIRLALWRWAVVAVTAVVVIGAILVNTNRRENLPEAMTATISTPTPAPSAAPATLADKSPAPNTRAEKEATVAHATPSARRQEKKQVAKDELAKGQPANETLKPAPTTETDLVAQSEPAAGNAVVAQAPATAQSKVAPEARRDVAGQAEMQAAGASAPAAAPPPMAPAYVAGASNQSQVMKMKPGRPATASLDAYVPPRWTISSRGEVQKSLDGGRSWTPLRVSEGAHFRAIAAIGADIWAGGTDAALFHSRDGGQTWTRVRPSGLAGDIVRIEFRDLQQGTISTSAGESCSTPDGGQTWLCR